LNQGLNKGKGLRHAEAPVTTTALALVPAFSPAEASSLTLSQRVAKLEAKLKCVVKTPVSEFVNFASYGDPFGDNFTHVYTSGDTGEAPDQLNDSGTTFGLDWDFGNPAPNAWVLTIKADADGFVSSTCAKQFPKQVTPSALRAGMSAERLLRARQLARVQ
jgi:hypothetical protein